MNIGDCVQLKDPEREGWIGEIIRIVDKSVESDVVVDWGNHGTERCRQVELDVVDCISFEFYDEV